MPVHYMDCSYPLLVTAHQDRFIHVWNLEKNISMENYNPIDVVESPLKFATSAVSCFADGKGYAVGSIEGRCGIQNYDVNKEDKNRGMDFCFKCHRNENPKNKSADVYSVNGFAFNKKYNTFATYGSDGTFVTWNKDTKSKYKGSKKMPSPVTACDFDDNANMVAYAIGYDWSRGAEGTKEMPHPVRLFIRTPEMAEVFRPSNTTR